ncbi:signal recognition particle protein [Methylocella sp.]|uniref:signal recognition particle protein n=1 Tax=Methylocella sp. TaxID=1978226 RepID=UPI0037853133
MFEGLSEKLSSIFDSLTRRGALTEDDVNLALREVRRALLEADVALDVVRSFVDRVRSRAVGADVVKSVTPGQMVVKIVHDVLVETLGSDADPINLDAAPPVAIMMVGLQGAGKTTTAAKIAKRLKEQMGRKVLMASLDVKRPAAQEQLAVLGRQIGVETLPIVAGQTPVQIAVRAEQAARLQGFDVVLIDTAGRTHIDEALMREMAEIKAASRPHEILLVADSLTGQDAVNLAKSFDERVGLTGIVLTRVDGDGRGGAALSMRAVTGRPIKLIGSGEKMDALEDFHPARIANRILGMGDIVSLVEKAAQTIDAEKAQRLAERMRKGKFDLEDLSEQLAQVEKIGGLGGVLGMLPGIGKMKEQLAASQLDDRIIKRQRAVISSMTPKERRNPDLLKASRKKRVAAGAGVKVEDVNRLLKQHRQMADLMKSMGGKRGGGMMGKMAAMLGGPGGGMPGLPGGMMGGMPQPSPEQVAALQKQFGGAVPGLGGPAAPGKAPAAKTPASPSAAGKPAAPPLAPQPAAPKLPGLGAAPAPGGAPKLPGLGAGGGFLSGLNPFGKKK